MLGGVHSTTLHDVLEYKKSIPKEKQMNNSVITYKSCVGELKYVLWSDKVAIGPRHPSQRPFKRMRTIIKGPEIKRRSVLFQVLGGDHVLMDYKGLKKSVPRRSERKALIREHVTDCYVRQLSVLEEQIFQGLEFLNFPRDLTLAEIHGLIGNSLPPRLSSCLFHAIDDFMREENGTTWENRTVVDLFAGLGGFSMGVDYEDTWCHYINDKMTKTTHFSEDNVLNNVEETLVDCSTKFITAPLEDFEHLLLIDNNVICHKVLQNTTANEHCYKWSADAVYLGDVGELSFQNFKGQVGILCGGPPCQSFSSCGQLNGMEDNRQGWDHCARALVEMQPEVFVFENVSNLAKNKKMKETIIPKILENLNDPCPETCPYVWQVIHFNLNCSHYGIPQSRIRHIFIGYRELRTVRGNKKMTDDEILQLKKKFMHHLKKYKLPDKRTIWEVITTHAVYNDAKLAEMNINIMRSNKKTLNSPWDLWRIIPEKYMYDVT
jgi:site-specific DNA-cytosine methylase